MADVSILSPSGFPYQMNGFQSLSGRRALQLRSGSSLKQPHSTDYLPPKWCPTLDILAVPEGRALRLVRLSGGDTIWRRTLQDSNQATPPKAESVSGKTANIIGKDSQAVIRAIAWNPTSQCIAVLYSDGNLVQRDAAHGDIVHESRIELANDELVASMLWVSCDGDTEPSTDILAEESSRTAKPLPLEFSIPALSPLDKSKATPSNINSEPDNMTAIVITTTRGAVWIMLGGIFTLPVAKLPLFEKSSFADLVVTDAQINCDLSTLYVSLTRGQGEQPSGRPNAALCTLDTSMLSAATPLLRSLVYLSARISGLFLYIENAVDLVVNEATARGDAASRAGLLQTFEGILQDHGVDEVTSPEAELCRLAVTGRASEPTSQFLLAKLKSAKLKSWEHSGRQGAVAIARLIYQYVSPAIERAMFAASRLLHIVTVDFSQLSLAGYNFGNHNGEGCSVSLKDMEETRGLILRAIVILGWTYARFEEYAARLQDEQRENQTFVDWALLAVDDLHWQNEGIHKSGNDDSVDDGLRPIRPEIDHKLLLQFIRSAFRRRSADDAPDAQIETLNILNLKGDRNKADSDIVQAYFDILAERSNPGAIQGFQPKPSVPDENSGVFEFPFHSSDLLDEATRRCPRSHPRDMDDGHLDCAIPPPTCREALTAAKVLTTQALAWPSAVLGNGLQWNAQSDFAYFSATMCAEGAGGDTDYDTTVGRISDMHCISNATSDSVHGQRDGAGTVYLATVSAGSQVLEILALPGLSSRSNGGAEVDVRSVSISLTVKTSSAEHRRAEMDLLSLKPAVQASEKTRSVRVTGISFFDDSLLGITFTIDGCDSSYLGTISYRQDHGRIAYSPVPKHPLDNASGQTPGDVTSYPLEFAKLLRLDKESSRYRPVSLSTNGRPGRRSIAIVERRGKLWWPYDMDNSEDEGDD